MSTHDGVRTQLQEQLGRLLQRVEKIEGDLRSLYDRDAIGRPGESDRDDLLAGLDETTLAQLRQMRAALERLQSGSYETCSVCGQAIDAERLAALPTTVTCVNCAT